MVPDTHAIYVNTHATYSVCDRHHFQTSAGKFGGISPKRNKKNVDIYRHL
jgi:hypothetical protein